MQRAWQLPGRIPTDRRMITNLAVIASAGDREASGVELRNSRPSTNFSNLNAEAETSVAARLPARSAQHARRTASVTPLV